MTRPFYLLLVLVSLAAGCGGHGPQVTHVASAAAPPPLATVTPRHASSPAPIPTRTPEPVPTSSAPCTCLAHDPDSTATLRTAFAHRTPEWAGGDVLDAVALPDGRRLWIFGDTFYGTVSPEGALGPDTVMVHSSAVIQDGGCFDPIVPPGGRSWAPGGSSSTWLWPQNAAVAGDELVVFTTEIESRGNGVPGLNFNVVGGVALIYRLDDLTAPAATITDVPAIDQHPFGWGIEAVDHERYLYAHVEGEGTYAARAPEDALLEFERWTYWDGHHWVPDVDHAVPIHPLRLRVNTAPDGSLQTAAIPFGERHVVLYDMASPVGPVTERRQVDLDPIWPTHVDGWAYQPLLLSFADDTDQLLVNFLPWDVDLLWSDVHLYGPRVLPAPAPAN